MQRQIMLVIECAMSARQVQQRHAALVDKDSGITAALLAVWNCAQPTIPVATAEVTVSMPWYQCWVLTPLIAGCEVVRDTVWQVKSSRRCITGGVC